MINFIAWCIAGSMIWILLNGILAVIYCGLCKCPDEEFDRITDEVSEKMCKLLSRLVDNNLPRILQLLLILFVQPIYWATATIYTIKGIDEYRLSRKNSSA